MKFRHARAYGCLVLLLALLPPGGSTATTNSAPSGLQGRIQDPGDNGLPGVRVGLQRARVAVETDGNGLFRLDLPAARPLQADAQGIYDLLDLDKDGYQGRTLEIRDPAFFDQPLTAVLEPNPVGADTVGFSVRMSSLHSIHGLPRAIGLDTNTFFPTTDQLRQALEKVAARQGSDTARAWFHVYVPTNGRPLRAAFLISRHGMGTIDHPVLRAFAEEESVALVGVLGAPVQVGCHPVSLLDPYLERLAALAKRPELARVPVLTFGHSNGTGFATVFAADRPERLIGWISYHSGWSWQLLLPGVERVPGLVMHGHQDPWLEHGQEQAVRDLRRQRNAPVAMMLEANVSHGPVNAEATWTFIVEFCKAAMRIRLNADGSLRPVVLEQGWLGGGYDRARGGQQDLPIAPYADFAGDRAAANWLPDRAFAETWQAYGRTDPRTATRVPAAVGAPATP